MNNLPPGYTQEELDPEERIPNPMAEAIKNYTIALEAHQSAQREENVAKAKVRKTRYALLMARQEMQAMERQVLEDNLNNL